MATTKALKAVLSKFKGWGNVKDLVQYFNFLGWKGKSGQGNGKGLFHFLKDIEYKQPNQDVDLRFRIQSENKTLLMEIVLINSEHCPHSFFRYLKRIKDDCDVVYLLSRGKNNRIADHVVRKCERQHLFDHIEEFPSREEDVVVDGLVNAKCFALENDRNGFASTNGNDQDSTQNYIV